MPPLPCRSVTETHSQGKGTRKKRFFPHFLDYGTPFSWFLWLERWILYLCFSFHICASSQPHSLGLPAEQYCKSKERKKKKNRKNSPLYDSLLRSVDSFLKILPAFVFFSLVCFFVCISQIIGQLSVFSSPFFLVFWIFSVTKYILVFCLIFYYVVFLINKWEFFMYWKCESFWGSCIMNIFFHCENWLPLCSWSLLIDRPS